MERMNKIIQHPLWKESMQQIMEIEETRIFCKHDFQHFMDVARIAYIENLEKNIGISKEWIYAAAFLHDIGRHLEYKQGISHEIASSEIAAVILKECGFEEEAQKEILNAIQSHRNKEQRNMNTFEGIIYRADKKSRNCMFCEASKECNWDITKKNLFIER